MHLRITRSLRVILLLAMAAGIATLTFTVGPPGAAAKSGIVEVTFTKWVTDAPSMAGVVGGDTGPGVFAGEIITQTRNIGGGRFNNTKALYQVRGGAKAFDAHTAGGANSFDALVDVWTNNQKGTAVFNGFVVDGWLAGQQVTGDFKIINCKEAPNGVCFQGTIRVMAYVVD
jgi:hypothetical protein